MWAYGILFDGLELSLTLWFGTVSGTVKFVRKCSTLTDILGWEILLPWTSITEFQKWFWLDRIDIILVNIKKEKKKRKKKSFMLGRKISPIINLAVYDYYFIRNTSYKNLALRTLFPQEIPFFPVFKICIKRKA